MQNKKRVNGSNGGRGVTNEACHFYILRSSVIYMIIKMQLSLEISQDISLVGQSM
jgi:hypothetical protein